LIRQKPEFAFDPLANCVETHAESSAKANPGVQQLQVQKNASNPQNHPVKFSLGKVFIMKMTILCSALLLALPSASAFADTFDTYGDVNIVAPGPGGRPTAYQIIANPSGMGYGGLQVFTTTLITPDTLTDLSANYQWLAGPFGGGDPQAPRFTLYDSSSGFNPVYLYWGTNGSTVADPNAGAYGSTGNLAGGLGSTLYVVSDGFGGVTNTTPETWATFLTQAGTVAISDISLDIDGPSGSSPTPTQEADVTSFTINSTTYTASVAPVPEPGSLMLLATGMLGAAGTLFRRRVTA
jgi:hypothetical protein